ncbi:MAG: FG-GAP-like repeat-containing protein [Ferruginibacter sp.]
MNKIFTLAILAAFIPNLYSDLPVDYNSISLVEKTGYFFNFKNNLPNPFEPEKKPTEAWSQNWMGQAQENIRKSEYHFNWEEKLNAYCTPNRKNNLRFFYDDNGFSVEPRTTKIPVGEFDPVARPDEKKYRYLPNWKINFNLDKKQVGNGEWRIANNKAEYITDNITVQYINNDAGMRQNFIVQTPLTNDGELKLNFSIKTKLKTYLHGNQLQFFHKKTNVLNYTQLKVWDAEGKALEASLKKLSKNNFFVEVNTKNAVYPITIDPLSETPDNTPDDADQPIANFGISVASAGDVNGDGYSDVIIGANLFDDGASTNEGGAFVYHGSATGLSASPNSTPDDADQANANFGFCVAGAGDVNGDGYSDVIIGAYLYDEVASTNEGRVFVYHGSATGISATPNSTHADANQAFANFGISVAGAGDINGDGYSDVIIGAHLHDDGVNTNEGRAFVYHGSAAGVSATPNSIRDDANQANANFGRSVAGAGDVNGDGYSDVIIGAYGYTDGASNQEGRAFVYHGSAAGITATPNTILDDANQVLALFGWSVACAGDVNGDGYSDVIIGAYNYDDGANTDEGRAFLYHGSAVGLSTTPAIILDDADVIFARFGRSVACAGDVNGDGYSDVIIGAYGFNDGANTGEGRAFVYHGSAAGLSATPNSTPDDADQFNASFGNSVACAGDINGDGYSDIIIGANLYNDGANNQEGRAFVYHGSAAGINTTAANSVESNQLNAQMGISAASAGDVNGDGYSDVIVGAYFYDSGETDEGAAFIYHGSATGINTTAAAFVQSNQANAFMGVSVASAGDVNGDGYSDVIVGAYEYDNGESNEGAAFIYHGSVTGINTTAAAFVQSNQANANMGSSVASAGDVNGDGYSDIIVGAWTYFNFAINAGAAFVYHGSATGINTIAAAFLTLNNAYAYMGRSVASAGDVNGDGYSDIIVGAFSYFNGQPGEGAAFVYHGSAAGINTTAAAILEGNQIAAQMGFSVASAGDVNGDGYGDVIVGAYAYDNGETDEGAAFIYHGSAAGINTTAASFVQSNQANANMGISVASAGDVNGDGYTDVIVGAFFYDNGETDEGAAFIYHGSATGINTIAAAFLESNQINAQFGNYVASAGDVNGDGYSDIIVGSYQFDNGLSDEGAAFIYHGNSPGTNTRNNLRLYNTDLLTPINSSNFILGNFGAGLYAKSFLGRAKGKLVWETRLNFDPYSGTPITNSTFFTNQQSSYTDLGLAGTEIKNLVNKIWYGGRYTKVRARIKYDPVTALTGQVYGPWRNLSSVIDANHLGALPVDLISFNAAWLQKGKSAKLNFTTDKENGICCFDIEKSTDGFNFYAIGTVAAKNTSSLQSYSFIDGNANDKNQYYRLKIKGLSGKTELSNIHQLTYDKAIEILVFPNPTTDVLQLQLNRSFDKMNLQIVNSSGQIVKQLTVSASNQTITIPVQNLAAGKYWLRLQSGDDKQVLQFVKQ